MACSKWEEIGLLYCSCELDKQEVTQYEAHLKDCSECNSEFHQYQKEKSSLFTSEILGENTSREIDDEIIRVCTAKKQYTSIGTFPSIVKKSVFSASFFLLGFVVVGYFTFNIKNANIQKQRFASEAPAFNSPALAQKESTATKLDSIQDSAVYFSRTRGNLGTNGVYPVDLK